MKIFISIILFFNTSCIHLNSTDQQSVDLKRSNSLNLEKFTFEKIEIDNLVYKQSEYPLEEFLRKLIAGDFNKVLNNIDFKYTPSNTDNEIILELIKEGLIPVYVSIKNTGSAPVKISEKNFSLSDGVIQLQALDLNNIPKSFERFNSKAILANTYNISVAIIGTVIVLAVLGIIFKGSLQLIGSGGRSSPSYSSGGRGGADIINSTQKTTQIDYQNYLISERTLEPDEVFQGLLFFSSTSARSNLRLKFQ